jgi:hypothetical protein
MKFLDLSCKMLAFGELFFLYCKVRHYYASFTPCLLGSKLGYLILKFSHLWFSLIL